MRLTSVLPRRAAGLVLAAAACCLPGLPAQPATADPVVLLPGARLVLTVHHGRQAGDPVAVRATLTCLPAGGSHPKPHEACTALLAAGGDFDRLRARREEMCPLLIDPVTVTARGRWLARPVAWRRTFANRCVAARDTGGVFAF